jgi:hypothetical protein
MIYFDAGVTMFWHQNTYSILTLPFLLGLKTKNLRERIKLPDQPYMAVVCPSGNVKNLGGRPLLVDLEKLKELHAAGMTDVEIVYELGVKRSTVAMARKRLGLTANRRVGEHGGTTI